MEMEVIIAGLLTYILKCEFMKKMKTNKHALLENGQHTVQDFNLMKISDGNTE
jgi:hypothetical protein